MKYSIIDKLAVVIGVFFIGGCIPKIVPLDPYHEMMVVTFQFWAHVFPLVHLGLPAPNAALYRTICGVLELSFGSLLAFGRTPFRRGSAGVLMAITVISIYSMAVLGSTLEFIPAVILALVLLLCIIYGFEDSKKQTKSKNE
ncbi:uncharacterized protein LOC117113892 [Anneissia japonica]|uniref:uncharacterized protein LOC117113892 n=1 Tax=Anneissia japonica TaxID=1529436 RepID=UPI0014255CFD|nr:uncharacterized protein LOC117113892 [Anneissia japonica]XP_033113268.1 uncharacterized protein LOC117113892 [Anneissia japonica]XP_033113269.1 uncharacterized protein LOC117113892 [Anneissia japonica]XP_033113270.1 uncharacterized protein LOC117113892 [Anneissia japonica]XP_033113271.1 uncharacterized protein LOC117113892 [Anneissia japonica]